MAKSISSQNMKILNKIIDAGYGTEKDVLSMTIDKILAIQGITVSEISAISEFQKAVKANKVITFLSGGLDNDMDKN